MWIFFLVRLGDGASLEKNEVLGCLYQGACHVIDGSVGAGKVKGSPESREKGGRRAGV